MFNGNGKGARLMRRLLWTALLLAAILVRAPAEADPLSTASFIVNGYTDPITGSLQGCVQFTYHNAPYMFGSTTVNLGDPSNPYYVGGLFCTFTAPVGHCTSSPDPTLYSFDFSGSSVPCSGPSCVTPFVSTGITNFSGSVYQALAQLLPDAAYTFDGTFVGTGTLTAPSIAGCSLPSSQIAGASGQIGFNVFVPVSTDPGPDVTVTSTVTAFNPVTGTIVTTPVSVNFAGVTGGGVTQVTATSSVAGTMSSNFSTSGDGYQAEFFDVSTTAAVTPPITVCQQYQVDANGFVQGTTVPETNLRILHGDGSPPAFVDVTSSQDTSTHTICGTVSSLSPFVVAALATTGPCTTGPEQDCKHTTVPLSAQLLISEPTASATTHKGDTLVWKWLKGAPTTTSDFGNPLTTDSYALCIYESTGALSFAAGAPAGGTCQVGRAQVPCWKGLGKPAGTTGFKYNNPARTPDGITSIVLKPGALNAKGIGTAHISVNGKGPNLLSRPTGVPGLPALPLTLPQRVQLQASSGRCWEATYSNAGKKTNTGTHFNGKGN
jgi:hypothetical protein